MVEHLDDDWYYHHKEYFADAEVQRVKQFHDSIYEKIRQESA